MIMKATSMMLLCSLAIACKGDPEEGPREDGPPAAPERDISENGPGASTPAAARPVTPAPTKPEKINYLEREHPAPKLATFPKDVIGLQLGMTPARALQALEDENLFPKGTTRTYWSSPEVTFFDTTAIQNGQNKTTQRVRAAQPRSPFDVSNEAHVVQSIAHAAGSNRVVLQFALPPEPNVLIEIGRSAAHHDPKKNEGTALDIFEKAAIDKYGEPAKITDTARKGDALKTFIWAQPGKDCSSNLIRWFTATPSTTPAPEECATTLAIEVNHFTQGQYLGMVQYSSTTLGNRGSAFLNQQRHAQWLKQTKLNWEQARRDQIRAAGKDTQAPSL